MKISTHAPLAGRDGRRKVRRALCQGFQPTRPLRGATVWLRRYINGFVISTHAPLAGRDKGAADARALAADFNPRAPCGARPARHGTIAASRGFQPTRPLRGATSRIVRSHPGGDFNPRAPCGARRTRPAGWNQNQRFQPTRPLRGATRPRRWASMGTSTYFNPRAPCGARRASSRWKPTGAKYFNPRAPCGARPSYCGNI